MRRFSISRGWPAVAILAALAAPPIARGADDPAGPPTEQVKKGSGPAYAAIGKLPVSHEGRTKPLDTAAREEVDQIYSRETIKLPNVDGKVEVWSPVAAMIDWSIRPRFWDKQPIISLDYLPLKQFIFHAEVHEALDAIAEKSTTPAATREALSTLAHASDISAADLRDVARNSGLPEADGREIVALSHKVGEETRWYAPDDLENLSVAVDGKPMPLHNWLERVSSKANRGGMNSDDQSPLDRKAVELGGRIAHYRSIRDREPNGPVPISIFPRPSGKEMLAYTTAAVQKMQAKGQESLDPLEYESVKMLYNYSENVQAKDRAMPGEKPEFDERYSHWLREKSAWVPLSVVLGAPADELTRAGFPAAKLEAFRKAFGALEAEEKARPGEADPALASTLLASAHDLGLSTNPTVYPSDTRMDLETFFNVVAPFWYAPGAYGLGAMFLALSLAIARPDVGYGRSVRWSTGFYWVGMAGFVLGIGLEVLGFVLRVIITGWAPVTNMYETVIWVAFATSILGLALEMIYRKTYPALAASCVALVGTALAANVPLLDPGIHQLAPVLRDNFWLSIHVLTIVSSYAAFALAMGLGMISTGHYLFATYKRRANLAMLAIPLVPGLPLAMIGWAMKYLAGEPASGTLRDGPVYYAGWTILSLGATIAGAALFALVGEAINRVVFTRARFIESAMRADAIRQRRILEASATGDRGDFGVGGGTAVMTAPPVVQSTRFGDDDGMTDKQFRAESMRETGVRVKSMAGFIYRSMQVGVLLVAAGTFLGGWWADVSWGRFWGWDPKEVWALITLLVYLIPLHGRFAGWVNTFWLTIASVVCFSSVLMAWYGVNFVLGIGLHNYGFTENAGQFFVGSVVLAVLAYAGGACWRRHVASAEVATA